MPDLRTALVDTSASPHARLRSVPIGAVRMEDSYWAPRLVQLREQTLPSQHAQLEETGRIDNFRRAAGKQDGEFAGIFFNDSDVYKWIEAACLSLACEPDARLDQRVDEVIAEVAGAQCENGYLNTYFMGERVSERWTDLRVRHELYCAGHLIQAAVAHHRATGRRPLLDVAVRFADHIDATFGPNGLDGVPGHPELEMALVELARETGERRYLDLASFFIDHRGRGLIGGQENVQDHLPFREMRDIVGHAVRAIYLNAGAADVVLETGEPALCEALERLWSSMVERRMYITGGVGARHAGEAFGDDYELPNDTAYAETCAAIASVMWNWRMLLATGEAKYADVMELALYNGAMAGLALDSEHYFYENPLSDDGDHRRVAWFSCACCPPNIARLIPSVPGMIYSTSTEGLWVHLYASSAAEIRVHEHSVRIRQRTGYPWDGEVHFDVDTDEPCKFSMMLRIPEWCDHAVVTVGEEAVQTSVTAGEYCAFEREWRPGDRLTLSLSMPVRTVLAHPAIDAVAGRAALARGPVVFCFEQADQSDADIRTARLALNTEPAVVPGDGVLEGVPAIAADGTASDPGAWATRPYVAAGQDRATRRRATLRAIPYAFWANRDPGPMRVWLPYDA